MPCVSEKDSFHRQDAEHAERKNKVTRRPQWLCGVCLVAALAALCLGAETPVALPPGVDVKTEANPEKGAVGDPIRIDLEVVLPREYQMQLPTLDRQAAEFTILEPFTDAAQSSSDLRKSPPAGLRGDPMPDGRLRYRASLTAALYRVGQFEFPALRLSLRDEKGHETVVSTPPVKVEIQTILTEKDSSLKDLKKQADVQDPVNWVLWLALALIALILAALGWWVWRRRRRPAESLAYQPELDPFDAAEAELRDLIGRGFLEKGFVKQFYVGLSEILKKTLEAGYGIHTAEKTTGEIMECFRSERLTGTAEGFERIESLLLSCDLVKFAKYVPSRSESGAAVNDALLIIEACRTYRSAPAPSSRQTVAEAP